MQAAGVETATVAWKEGAYQPADWVYVLLLCPDEDEASRDQHGKGKLRQALQSKATSHG